MSIEEAGNFEIHEEDSNLPSFAFDTPESEKRSKKEEKETPNESSATKNIFKEMI